MNKERSIDGLFDILANHNTALSDEERAALKSAIKLLSKEDKVTIPFWQGVKTPVNPQIKDIYL